MMSDRKKTCKAITFALVTVLIFSSLFAYIYYRDLKKTFIARLSGKASSLIGQQINIGDISFSLLSGVNVHDIQIQNPKGFETGQFLKVNRISLKMNYRELFHGKLHFSHIYIYAPELTVMKDPQGRLNISDELRRFLSKKGTLNYEVDEVRISSGMTDFDNDGRLRNERINLSLKKLSSSPGTKTLIEGDTMWSGENRVRLDGWANLSDEGKKFRISVSAEDFRLSVFRMLLTRYPVDVENTGLKMVVDAEGDTDNGVNVTSRMQIKSPGGRYYKKNLLAISIDAAVFYDVSEGSARIKTMSIKVGDDSALVLSGIVKDLQRTPLYDLKMKINSLDLSVFNILRGFQTGGILMSDAISIKGRFNTLPEVSGLVELKDASVKSATADVRKMNARMIFSSDRDISARAEASAEVLSAGGYSLSIPAKVGLSMNAKARKSDVAFTVSVSSSPIYMETGKKMKLSLEDVRVLIDGTLREKDFSGKSTVNARKMQYDDYSLNSLRGVFKVDYKKNIVTLQEVKIETENFSSSADLLKIDMSGKSGRFLMEAKTLGAAYSEKEAGLHGLDLSVTLNTLNKDLSGDLRFSVAGVKLKGVSSGRISGSGNFDNNDFFLEIPQADISGGRIRLVAQGKTSQGPFPLKAEVTAEHIDLGEISRAAEKHLQGGYLVSGSMESLSFKGTVDSKESLRGETALELQRLSVLNTKTKKFMLKNASMRTDVTLNGKDCEFKTAASAGALSTMISGSAKGFLSEGRSVHMQGHLNETPVNEIRNTFWDMFPDSLLYAGMDGSVSSDINLDYGKEGVAFGGDLRLKDFVLKGENNEYSVGPVNGVVPFAYGKFGDTGKTVALPSFERSEFAVISRRYADEQPGVDYNRITIGSLQYGFRLLEDITVWIKQDGSILNVGRFSANIFGGRLNGSAVIDLSDGLNYRAGVVLQGLSLTKLCDDIEPIKGYISGKVDGIGLLKGSGAGLQGLIGRADFWTYSTKDEKTKISKEFLQKIGGPSIKSYLGDRSFNKGLMSFYVQNGFLVFRDLEIANRNLLGIQDLSVKVAPLNNRISIDHLMWTLVEAAERAKKNSE
jgi:hypothetical protein